MTLQRALAYQALRYCNKQRTPGGGHRDPRPHSGNREPPSPAATAAHPDTEAPATANPARRPAPHVWVARAPGDVRHCPDVADEGGASLGTGRNTTGTPTTHNVRESTRAGRTAPAPSRLYVPRKDAEGQGHAGDEGHANHGGPPTPDVSDPLEPTPRPTRTREAREEGPRLPDAPTPGGGDGTAPRQKGTLDATSPEASPADPEDRHILGHIS